MPRSRADQLTWLSSQKCWSKWWNGQRHYLSPRGTKKSDPDAKAAALENWFRIRAGSRFGQSNSNAQSSGGIVGVWKQWDEYRLEHACRISDYSNLPDDLPHVASSSIVGVTDLKALVDNYLAEKRGEARTETISVSTYREHRDKLADFQRFASQFGRTCIADVLHRDFLKSYQQEQRAQSNPKLALANSCSPQTAKKRLSIVRRFLEWCAENGVVEYLPPILNRKWASIDLPTPTPKTWTIDELQLLWLYSPQVKFGTGPCLLRLAILLGLNCAYLPSDISTLMHSMVNWESRMITRKRHKTGQNQQHKLWCRTVEMLRQHATTKENAAANGRVLVGAKRVGPRPTTAIDKILDNRPFAELVHDKIQPDGSTTRTDTIGRAFNKLLHEVKKRHPTFDPLGRSFKHLRKSSAQAVLDHFKSEELCNEFLGQAVLKNPVTKHYAEHKMSDSLIEACNYLEKYFEKVFSDGKTDAESTAGTA